MSKPNFNVCQQLLRLSHEKEAVGVNIGRRMSYSINQELKKSVQGRFFSLLLLFKEGARERARERDREDRAATAPAKKNVSSR